MWRSRLKRVYKSIFNAPDLPLSGFGSASTDPAPPARSYPFIILKDNENISNLFYTNSVLRQNIAPRDSLRKKLQEVSISPARKNCKYNY
jgi:hypothetical protein